MTVGGGYTNQGSQYVDAPSLDSFIQSGRERLMPIMHQELVILFAREGCRNRDGNGWSRLTDGNLQSYWKSNAYLARPFTGEGDSKHPQSVMIDLGSKVNVNAIRIAWANPYATRYNDRGC